MKKVTTGIFALCLALNLCACGEKEVKPTEPVDNYNYPEIHEKLTWDAINAFPVKSGDMTEDELRDLCVDFFRFTKTALWIPDENWEYVKTKNGNLDNMYKGNIYGGLPYVGVASGSIYRLMDYIDEETGVVDMTEPMKDPTLFGNQCSIGAYWGWGRVVNSADYLWTSGMVQKNGFLRVGPYTYNDNLSHFEEGICTTADIINQNGANVMYESYAAMKRADGFVYFTSAGHTMMCATDPVVIRNADGSVDGSRSYVTIIDQHGEWTEATNASGDTYRHKNYVDRKFTFNQLLTENYIPFTFGELIGTDPVEPTECAFSHSGVTVTLEQLVTGKVTANYGISDAYAILKDKDGNELLRGVKRGETANVRSMDFVKAVDIAVWREYAGKGYTVEVHCQLSTGERPCVYTGILE